MKAKGLIYGAVASTILLSNVVTAQEFRGSSVRALGMGGSNVASTSGVDASYWNPAAYGFFGQDDASADAKSVDNSGMNAKIWGLDVGGDAGLSVFGPVEANVNKLQALVDPSAIPTGQLTQAQVAGNIQNAADFVNGIAALDPAPLGANLFADAGVGVRVSNYGVSARLSVDVNGSIALDNTNTKLDVFTSLTGGNTPALTPTTVTGLPTGYFTQVQRQSMFDSLTTSSGLTSQQAVATVVAYDAALTANAPAAGTTAQDMTDSFNTLATASGDITKNNTAWAVRGAAVTEVGVTYGHALNDNLSLGVVVKYMQADVYNEGSKIIGAAVDTAALNTNKPVSSTAFGLDVGMMYRIPEWQFGLTVRNLNGPSFRHSAAYTYTLDPQAKVGAAWMPSEELTIEAGLDLTKNKAAVATSESQYWNVGLEWDAWSILAVRLGAFENMAQTDIGLVPTIGLGLNLWAMRIDLAGAVSTNTVTLGGSSVPAYAMGSLALSADF